MKRKPVVRVKTEDEYPNKRLTRSMASRPKEDLTVSQPQICQTGQEILCDQGTSHSPSERSRSSSISDSRSQMTNEDISEDASADANILIKMEEVKESLKDGVNVTADSTNRTERLCQICCKVYSTDKVFENHLKFVHDPEYKLARQLIQNSDILPDENNPDFYCCVCIRTFTCLSSFRGHLENIHKMKLKQRPRVLQRSLINKFIDVKPDHDDPNFNCCVCQKNFSGKYNYRRHIKQVHQIKLDPLSGIKIVNPSAIPDPNNPDFYCNVCEKKFREKPGYLSHLEVVHYMQPVRRQRASNADDLPDEDDPNNYCKVCKKTLGSKRSYRGHLRSIHVMHLKPTSDRYKRILNAGKVPDPNDPNNYCLVCEKTFGRHDSFRVHLKTLHNIIFKTQGQGRPTYAKTQVTHSEITPDENNPNFYCQSCMKTFRSKATYRRHLRQVHKMTLTPLLPPEIQESGILPDRFDPDFFCHPCDVKYSNKKDFWNHLSLSHPSVDVQQVTKLPDVNDPDSHCSICDKKYPNGNVYRKHLRRTHRMIFPPKRNIKKTINPEKVGLLPELDDPNFFCRVCEKTYESLNRYRKHLRISHHMNLVPLIDLRIANKEIQEDAASKVPLQHLQICGICRKGFADDELYQHHCEGVPTTANERYVPEKHIKSAVVVMPDENDPNFYCKLCQTNSPDRHTFHNHLEFAHKMELVNRSKAPTFKEVSPEELPNAHDPNNHCRVCNKTYSNRDNYHGHIRLAHNVKIGRPARAHPILHPELTPDINDPNLFCCACEKTFACKSPFRHHLATIHQMKWRSRKTLRIRGKLVFERPDLKPDENDPDFFCCTCQRNYANRNTYLDHLINVHDMDIKSRQRKKVARKSPESVGTSAKENYTTKAASK